jgi:hypothetical protein
MKLELLIIGITGLIIFNIYHDGKYTKMIFSYKKYFQMGFFGIIGISLYLLIRRNPLQSKRLLLHANNMIKYMPIDKSSLDILSPILDFTSSNKMGENFMGEFDKQGQRQGQDVSNSSYGGFKPSQTTKRCVSETKKKYVASSQNWTCGNCKKQLNAYFEIDHKIRLQHGGSNNVDNLVALCPNCHREKTALESM